MELCYSWLASLLDPESNRRYRSTWSPNNLPRVAVLCPWVVYGRIENRIQDLEGGGDGFGIPYCDCGYAEILVLQRDIARIWGYPSPEDEKDHAQACRYPWSFLAETEAGLYRACVARSGGPVMTPYRSEAPMCILDGVGRRRSRCSAGGRSLIIPPDGPPGSPYVGAPLFQPPVPMPVGPPSGPLAIMPEQWPGLYDIEECEERGARRWREGSVMGDGGGEYWRGGGRRSRSGVGSGRGAQVGGEGRDHGAGDRDREGEEERGRGDGRRGAEPGESVRTGASRAVERSDGNVPAGSGILDGGRSDGSSRVRSVRARPSISSARGSPRDETGKKERGGENGEEKGA